MSDFKEDIFAKVYQMLDEKGFGQEHAIWDEFKVIKYLFAYSVGNYNHEQRTNTKIIKAHFKYTNDKINNDGYKPSFRAISKGWKFGDKDFDVAELYVEDRAFCLKVNSALTDEDMEYLYRFYKVLNRLSEINIDILESIELLIDE